MSLFKRTRIIAIANQKGGVGKTTTAINLGHMFSRVGKRVVYMDLDPQANGTQILSAGRSEFESNTISDIFMPPAGSTSTLPISSLILPVEQRNKSKKEALTKPVITIPNYFYVPSNLQLASVIESGMSLLRRESILSNALRDIKDGEYDYIILDCPPNLSLTTVNAIVASDLVLVVLDRGTFSMVGMTRFIASLSQMKDLPVNQLNFYIAENGYVAGHKVVNEKMIEWLKSVKHRILPCRIRRMQDVENSYAEMSLVGHYKPSSLIMNDYAKLAKEVYFKLEPELVDSPSKEK